MSVKVMGRVWELDLPANEKFVLLALADHADHDGNNVFPGLELIAFKTGYTTQQVRRIERKLEKRGILIAVNRKPGKRIEYRIDTNIGVTQKRLHTIKMSPPTKSNPLHSDTPTPYISSTESTGINRHLEPSTIATEVAAQDSKPEKPKKERPANPMYDAIHAVWKYTASMNGAMEKMLKGTATKAGWKEYNLETPIAADELRRWAKWYRQTALNGDETLNMLEDRMKIQSSITQWQDTQRAKIAPVDSAMDLSVAVPFDPKDNWK